MDVLDAGRVALAWWNEEDTYYGGCLEQEQNRTAPPEVLGITFEAEEVLDELRWELLKLDVYRVSDAGETLGFFGVRYRTPKTEIQENAPKAEIVPVESYTTTAWAIIKETQ